MKKFIKILFVLSLSTTFSITSSACIIDQLVAETNNGVSWPADAPKWGQSFTACEDGEVWEIAFWPHSVTTGMHTVILTDINCVTMWTVNNVDLQNGNQVVVDLATGSGSSRTVTSGNSYIFQLIGPAGTNLQLWLSWVDPYTAGEDKTDGCSSYSLDWWFRVSIDEPLGALPIELISFDAEISEKDKSVELTFETASEIGASHFNIENAVNEGNFEEIGNIKSIGNSNVKTNYNFTHQKPSAGINYYRLKQVDEDGSFEYSKIINIRVHPYDINYLIFPNPTNGVVQISFPLPIENEQVFKLINLKGEIVISQKLVKETSSTFFDLNDLPKGIYIIQAISNQNVIWTERVIKY